MNIRVFAAGILATEKRHGREHPLTAGDTIETETEKAHRIFDVIGEEFGSHAQTALRFALTQDRLACVVFGLAEPEYLDEAIAATELGPLSAAQMDKISQVYADFSA